MGLTWSPITGPAGNIEFLLWLRDGEGPVPPTREELREFTQEARGAVVGKTSTSEVMTDV